MNSDDRNNWVTSNRKKNVQNIQYGVDINDREAVLKEYNHIKRKHHIVGIFLSFFVILLSFYIFDFYMVNYNDRNPFLSIQQDVDGGTLYQAIGYKVLDCDNGGKYIGISNYKTCDDLVSNNKTFEEVFYDSLLAYLIKENRYDQTNILEFKLNSISLDSKEEGSVEYFVNINYKCMDGSNKCFKSPKDFGDKTNINLYVTLNNLNEVTDISGFKNSGKNYDELIKVFEEKIKKYMVENNLMQMDNLKSIKIKLLENYGRYTFKGTTYADAYLVQVSYLCVDNLNTCVTPFKGEYYENFNFEMSMFLNEENDVLLLGPSKYFDIE